MELGWGLVALLMIEFRGVRAQQSAGQGSMSHKLDLLQGRGLLVGDGLALLVDGITGAKVGVVDEWV